MQATTFLDLVLDGAAVAAGLCAAVLLLRRLPIVATLAAVLAASRRALHVIAAAGISDHWKELVVPRYALRIMIGSSWIAVYLAALLAVFVAGFLAVDLFFVDTPEAAWARILRPETQLIAVAMGVVLSLALLRKRR